MSQDIDQERRELAQVLFEQHDFGRVVEAVSGWESDLFSPDRMSRPVYFRNDENPNDGLIPGRFTIEFEPDSSIIKRAQSTPSFDQSDSDQLPQDPEPAGPAVTLSPERRAEMLDQLVSSRMDDLRQDVDDEGDWAEKILRRGWIGYESYSDEDLLAEFEAAIGESV